MQIRDTTVGIFGHRFNWLFAGLLGIYSFLNIVILEGDRLYQVEASNQSIFFVILGISYSIWFGNFLIERKLLPLYTKFHPLLIQFIASFALAGIVAMGSVAISGITLGGAYSFVGKNLLLTGGFAFRINLFLNCVNAIVFFNNRFQQKQIETEKLKTETIRAQVGSLNAQLNPHFFFNNLNALSELISSDVKAAEKYLQNLSKIYRYVLQNNSNELVSLHQEMNFLNSYLDLLDVRFGDSLDIELEDFDKKNEVFIAPVVLQLLIENIVKHNFFTSKKPLKVVVGKVGESISVWNEKQKKNVVEESMGIGLKNIIERYAFLNREVIVNDLDDSFQVLIPLIHQHEDSIS
ncbi:sensor histidine kinase [Algoriphagus sediminis]|uniref:Histidine kinase n=1 Tax=Algoriphagus sediminis TaxID=3057113 RepID=A0ABT7Y7S2_9BACT|nr:histidine kinase [Algoriphagus sediminis]MDN3202569.1 histidine kinase [Algoriphagus sediminis]